MNTSEIAELQELLSEALNSLAIHRGRSGTLSVPEFRQILGKCRTNYDPNLSPFLSLCEPEISKVETKEKVLEFVNLQLSNYVRDGKILSATITFAGGIVGGSPIEYVVRNLLRLAVVDGPAKAAQAFADCATNSSCSYYSFFLITGVSIPAPLEVFEGITLMPLPEYESQLPSHLPFITNERGGPGPLLLQDLLGRTVVRVEYEVSPIFHRPAETYTFTSGPEQHFNINLKGQEIPDPNLDRLCQALSVVARSNVQSVMSWPAMRDYEVFDLGNLWGIGCGGYGATVRDSRLGDRVPLDPSRMDTIKTVYMGLTQLQSETWEKLRIPIDRWAKSMAEEDPVDQIVDLGIALESLYVPDSQGESRFRLASHASWHLGSNKAERRKLWKEFRDIYDARSQVVHNGRLRGKFAKASFDKAKFVRRGQYLCWQGINSVIEAGAIPDWSDLTMGDDVGSA